MTDYYSRDLKLHNLSQSRSRVGFEFAEIDLSVDRLDDVVDGVDAVFHQAGQPGVRSSWDRFDTYLRHNVEGTHRLLASLVDTGTLAKFVFASSSSVYGDASQYPTPEDALPRPQSPYGVTKLAAEHVCGVFARNFGVPAVSLRYFTVFGPRQRPDMAMHRLISSAIDGSPFPLLGDGSQIRDFTYVGDVVEANLLAFRADVPPGFVANVAGGSPATMRQVIDWVTELVGSAPIVNQREASVGDVPRTGGSTSRIRASLGWEPEVTLVEGLRAQVAWQREALGEGILAVGSGALTTD
jgi:nucleoside-diphosphate-sugar epimerase